MAPGTGLHLLYHEPDGADTWEDVPTSATDPTALGSPVGLNLHYLADAVAGTDATSLSTFGPEQAVRLEGPGGWAIIMPMRL